jgi:hypothetical protein
MRILLIALIVLPAIYVIGHITLGEGNKFVLGRSGGLGIEAPR